MKVGILSDTHGDFHPRIPSFFAEADEIWHAGDIGHISVLERLRAIAPVRAVHGNIDGGIVRMENPEHLLFKAEGVRVLMTHIGGYPGRYAPEARKLVQDHRPGLFICGHSHILRVMYDRSLGFLMVNPGAAGKYGIHRSITAIRMVIEGGGMKDLEVLDLPRVAGEF